MDEADVELNPHIGPACMPRGVWSAIPTQAKKRTHYITGALNARTGQVFCTEYERKNSTLLLGLLHQLHRTCRSARRITFIAENDFVRKSAVVQSWSAQCRNCRILFQPVNHPWVSDIERLWKQVHDTVARNNRCATMAQLMVNVRRFLDVCRYFSRSALGIARMN